MDSSRDLETEVTGLNIFDDKASAAGSFPTAMLGYERHSVDSYVREVEGQVSELRQQLRGAQTEMGYIREQVGETDFEKLGAHATGLLKAAEGQAKNIVERAETESARILAEARRSASTLRSSATEEAEDIRISGLATLKQVREEQLAAATKELAKTRESAEEIRLLAEQQSDAILEASETQRKAILEDARLSAAALLAEANRDAEAIRESAHREAERSLNEMKKVTAEAKQAVSSRLKASTADAEAAAKQVADAREQANKVRLQAAAEADEIRLVAHQEAEAIVSAARVKATNLLTSFEEDVQQRKEQVTREVAVLEGRKASVLAQLSNLRALADESAQEFGDADAAFAKELEHVKSIAEEEKPFSDETDDSLEA